MEPITTALLLSFGVGAILLVSRNTAPSVTPPVTPPVAPPFKPAPNPQQGTTEDLLAQARIILANPAVADPNQMDDLAAKLRAAGQPQVADQVQAAANLLRAQRGLPIGTSPGPVASPPVASPPGTPTGTPAVSPAVTALDQQAFLIAAGIEAGIRNQVPPAQINIEAAELLLPALTAADLTPRADQFQILIQRVRAGRVPGAKPIGANPNPSVLDPDLVTRINAVLNLQNPLATSKEAEAILAMLTFNYPTGFLEQKQAVQKRLAELQTQGR